MARNKSNKTLITSLVAGGGAAIGGYYLGSSVDNNSTNPAQSAFTSYSVLLPLIIGALGFFLLKGKNKSAAMGLLIGGGAGAAYGYMQYSKTLAPAGSPTAGTMGAAPPRAVRRALRNPNGSAIGASVLPRALRAGSLAFPKDAWTRQ